LQPDSGHAFDEAIEKCLRLGVDPVEVLKDQQERLNLRLAQEKALDRV
jgi:hypothetical protein